MSTGKIELDQIKKQQLEFQDLVDECNRNELGQSAKLLAMYIAVYKQEFGELPIENLLNMSESLLVGQELSQIIQDGIEEASSMLRMVHNEQQRPKATFYYKPSCSTIN